MCFAPTKPFRGGTASFAAQLQDAMKTAPGSCENAPRILVVDDDALLLSSLLDDFLVERAS